MHAQTRFGSLKEQFQNIAIGLSIQSAANWIVLPWFGFHPSVGQIADIAGIMTVISVARGYMIRRYNEWKRLLDVSLDDQRAIEDLTVERSRQRKVEGFSADDDDQLEPGELERMCAAYAAAAAVQIGKEVSPLEWQLDCFGDDGEVALVQSLWPKPRADFKPTYPRRNLVKALAIGVAAIGRLDRATRRGAR